MTTGLSTLVSKNMSKVIFLTIPEPTPGPAHALNGYHYYVPKAVVEEADLDASPVLGVAHDHIPWGVGQCKEADLIQV